MNFEEWFEKEFPEGCEARDIPFLEAYLISAWFSSRENLPKTTNPQSTPIVDGSCKDCGIKNDSPSFLLSCPSVTDRAFLKEKDMFLDLLCDLSDLVRETCKKVPDDFEERMVEVFRLHYATESECDRCPLAVICGSDISYGSKECLEARKLNG